jgi:hypothetical protein
MAGRLKPPGHGTLDFPNSEDVRIEGLAEEAEGHRKREGSHLNKQQRHDEPTIFFRVSSFKPRKNMDHSVKKYHPPFSTEIDPILSMFKTPFPRFPKPTLIEAPMLHVEM